MDDELPYHSSWPLVTYKFVTEPTVGVWNRVKRHPRNRTVVEDQEEVDGVRSSATVLAADKEE